jgi:putative polymerase
MAIFFNAALAIVNAHFHALSKLDVTLVEAAITSLAILVTTLNFRADMSPWVILLAFFLLLHAVLTLVNEKFIAIYLRDAIDIPIFIALGMVYARGNIVRLFFFIQCIVFLVLLVELLQTDIYSNIFDVRSYYVNTRDVAAEHFWNTSSDLYLSATRPDERYMFPFLGIHRASSVFLEPVSLGNYSSLAAILTFTFWRNMSRSMRIFFVATTLIILVGSDGRLAATTMIVITFGLIIFPLLPRYSNVFYLPGALLSGAIIITVLGLQPSGDNFAGRMAHGMDVLASLNAPTLFGLNRDAPSLDSGISYFITTQSVVGLIVVWLFICLVPRYRDWRSKIFVHGMCIYITFNLLVSYSLFSIKTASLMWFMYGYLLAGFNWRKTDIPKYIGMPRLHYDPRNVQVGTRRSAAFPDSA